MIYLLTSDGHRDSINFEYYATNVEDLKTLLIQEYKEMFGNNIIPESIQITRFDSIIMKFTFNYIDYDGELERGSYHYFEIKPFINK